MEIAMKVFMTGTRSDDDLKFDYSIFCMVAEREKVYESQISMANSLLWDEENDPGINTIEDAIKEVKKSWRRVFPNTLKK